MAKARKYNLLCPISRALDRVGDRWALLILRDLHAGPARFKDLQTGLTGIATNLLTDRLRQLIDDGLIEKRDGDHGVTLYALTKVGEKSRQLLFELALFGGQFPADENPRKPGNLRTIAVTLSAAIERVMTSDTCIHVAFIVDEEPYVLTVKNGDVTMRAGKIDTPDVTFETEYEAMLAASDGLMSLETFTKQHTKIHEHTKGKQNEFLLLLASAMAQFA